MQSVTIKDIAGLLGLAHTTVSRALNDHPRISALTKAKVRETADRLGYIANQGARAMRAGTSKLVGLIVPDVQNEFYGAAARVMAKHCAQSGYQMMLCVSEDDPQQEEMHVRSLREARAAGVLIVPSPEPTPTSIALLRQVPTVQFLRAHRKLETRAIVADDFEGIFAATRHLLALGHRRIGFIGGAKDMSTGRSRMAGYEAALREAGIEAASAWIQLGPAQPDFGAQALQAVLSSAPRVTALVVASSRQLLGVLQAAHRHGVAVPQALSVVAYGNTEWFEISEPAISAVSLPVSAMSQRATHALFERLGRSRETPEPEPVFPTELLIRGSTAPPPPV